MVSNIIKPTCMLVSLLIALVVVTVKSDDAEIQKNSTSMNFTAILNSILGGYDKRARPNYGGKPVEVGLTIYVLNVVDVSESAMDWVVNFYMRQSWVDPRLQFSKDKLGNPESISLANADFFWTPDSMFTNEKKANLGETVSNDVYYRIWANGTILRVAKLTVKASCSMELSYFPMDVQICGLEIESFGHSKLDMSYKWADGNYSVGVSREVSVPQFILCGYLQTETQMEMSTGNYSGLQVRLVFQRSVGYYVIQWYLPTGAVVVLSFLAFWLGRSATGERVALGMTCTLTITIIWGAINESVPKVSYIKSIDVFMGFCFMLCCLSLLLSISIGYLLRKTRPKSKDVEGNRPLISTEGSGRKCKTLCFTNRIRNSKWCFHLPDFLEQFSRVMLPLIFIIFNICYWDYYNLGPAEKRLEGNYVWLPGQK